jgi:hypothetical protein
MLRSLGVVSRIALIGLLAATMGVPARAAIWPDELGGHKKTATSQPKLSEQAEYAAGAKRFEAAAYRLKDPTSAMAVFEWQRPAAAKPSKLGDLAAETADGVLVAFHNYVLRFTGWKPSQAELDGFVEQLRDVDTSVLPTLPRYLPKAGLVANSGRYVIGPVGLAQFDPEIPPAVAAFHLGAEAQLGRFPSGAGTMELAVFSYPTPQVARQQVAEFQKLPGAMAKFSGPLVAVILSPPDANAAERLLAKVRYEATITMSERVPTARDNVADLILNIFLLIGILLAIFLVTGLAFGFVRRWLGWGTPDEPMILLHLNDRE